MPLVTHILPVLLTSTIKQCSFYQFCTVSVRLISTCSKAALGVELNFSLQLSYYFKFFQSELMIVVESLYDRIYE